MATDSLLVKRDSTDFRLNDSTITIIKHVYGQDSIRFLSIHDDENTGADAAMDFIRENGGSLVELQYGNERNIKFNLTTRLDKCILYHSGRLNEPAPNLTLNKNPMFQPAGWTTLR